MSKTKWYTKAIYIALALALTISLAGIAAVSADPTKQSEWDDVSTPSRDDEVIADDSNILSFDMGPDGEVIFAVVDTDEDGYGEELYISDDGGVTWDDGPTEELEDEGMETPMLVSVASDDPDFLVVAGFDNETDRNSMVAGSDDGGDDFTDTSFPAKTEKIWCLDLSPNIDDKYNTAVGTDAGSIYRYEAGAFWGIAWKDTTTYTGWDAAKATGGITSLVFSPAFAGDDTILTLTTDGDQVWLQTGLWGTTKGWNDAGCGEPFPDPVAILDTGDDVVDPTPPKQSGRVSTGMALPTNYEGYDDDMRYVWVYVNFEDDTLGQDVGKVFEIDNDKVDYAGICCLEDDDDAAYPFMASISMTGEIEDGNLMVGLQGKKGDIYGNDNGDPTECCEGVQVYRTSEWPIDLCCPQWSSAKKPPTGQEDCLVAYTPDGDKGYAATSGDDDLDESAFSLSEVEEVGKYWNQLSLIDTMIDDLSDVAVNPDCGTIYLFSVNYACDCSCDSVWMSTDEGDSYMRVWCKALTGSDEIGLIRFAPEEEEEILTVYLVDRGTKVLYWNDDSGLTDWKSRKAATLEDIMDLAVESEDTIYAVDSEGDVSMSDEHGAPGSWSKAKDGKLAGEGHTIAVVDGNVLVGGDEGTVGYSDDGADSFSRLGDKGDLGADGKVHVAFDSYFDENDTVYAAVTDGDQGVWRWVIDDSTSWKDLKATEQDYFGIVLDNADGNPMTDADTGGVLYAVYEHGMARRLKPTEKPKAKKWDYLDNGLDGETFTIEPSALKICGCLSSATNSILWAINTDAYDIDDGEENLWNYEDCLAKAAPDLSAVADGDTIPADPCICVNEEFILEWDELCNSSTYVLTIALDEDFDYPITGMASGIEYDEYEVDDESIVILQGDLDCNQNYWWRVAVVMADDDAEVIRSWFSEGWSFMVEAGPLGAIELTSPDDGATNLPLTSIGFTWSAVAEATSYDWVLSTNADLSSPVESKTGLTDTAYTYTGTLKTSTTYFWRATALKDGNVLSESDISTFATAPEPVPAPTPPEPYVPPAPVTPAWVWVVIGIGAVLVIVVIVLIFRTRRV